MNENVNLILAKKRVGNRIVKDEKPKLRVADYCRVSTDSDEQAGSYEVQVQHYMEYIRFHKEWQFASVYFDSDISGCNTKKRKSFMGMIADYMEEKIDLILTKSIS